jgi:hypothetical protein
VLAVRSNQAPGAKSAATLLYCRNAADHVMPASLDDVSSLVVDGQRE